MAASFTIPACHLRVVGLLGYGGMGETLLVESASPLADGTDFERRLCLKRVLRKHVTNDDVLTRFFDGG